MEKNMNITNKSNTNKFIFSLVLMLFSVSAYAFPFVDKGFNGYVENDVYFYEHEFEVPVGVLTNSNLKAFLNYVLPRSCYLGHYRNMKSYDTERVVVRYALGSCQRLKK